MPKPARPTVSVVVPCLNEAATIERLLDGIAAQTEPPLEVIVVDGGSTDGTLGAIQVFERRHPALGVRIISAPGASIPAALNTGIRAAQGDIIVRLDAHACPHPEYLGRLVRALEATGVGVAGGRWAIEPGGPSAIARATALAVQHPLGAGDAAYRRGETAVGSDLGPVDVDTVPFGCFAKRTWAELGGFAEALATNEDYEFNYRVRRSGRRVVLDPGAVCVYTARATLRALARQYFRYGWWKVAMLERHPRSLKLRQAIPLAFGLTFAGLGLLSLLMGGLFLAGLVAVAAVYASVVVATAAAIAWRQGDGKLFLALLVVFPTIHFAWAAGALANLATLGRWPAPSRG